MLQTYQADIINSRVHWLNEMPENDSRSQRVLITIMDGFGQYLLPNKESFKAQPRSKLTILKSARGSLAHIPTERLLNDFAGIRAEWDR
jgi:hypothetical protein